VGKGEALRIVCVADLHFGHSEHLGKINPETGLHTRLEDFLRSFDQVIKYVLEPSNKVGLFLICGDLYKSRHPTNTQQEEFAKRLRLLQDKHVHTLLLTGNHDIVVSEGSSHTAGVLAALVNEEYISVCDKPGTFTDFPGVKIALMPYIYRQKLGVKTNEEAAVYYGKVVGELLQDLKQAPGDGKLMFVGHQTIEGCHMPAGYVDPELISEVVISQSFLKGFDFAVLGHIHEHQVVCQNPLCIYTGPIERIDFSQADRPVGFVVYDTDTGTCKFIKLPVADLYRVYVDLIDGQGDLTQRIIDNIDLNRLPGSIIKVDYKIRETDLCRINKTAILEIMDKAKFNYGLFPYEIIREHTSRNQEINESVSSQDALKKYIEGRQDLKDIADVMLKRGLEIIKCCEVSRK
jgi:exonuclease SbcD